MTNSKSKEELPHYDYLQSSCSQDFTGLIPSGPIDEEELSRYNEIYPIYPKVPQDRSR